MRGIEKELFEKEKLALEIKYMKAWQPDVFFSLLMGLAMCNLGNTRTVFWIECKGVNGEYFSNKYTGCDMVNTCESYFSALRTGDLMQEA